jgi:hypothetical protein
MLYRNISFIMYYRNEGFYHLLRYKEAQHFAQHVYLWASHVLRINDECLHNSFNRMSLCNVETLFPLWGRNRKFKQYLENLYS